MPVPGNLSMAPKITLFILTIRTRWADSFLKKQPYIDIIYIFRHNSTI